MHEDILLLSSDLDNALDHGWTYEQCYEYVTSELHRIESKYAKLYHANDNTPITNSMEESPAHFHFETLVPKVIPSYVCRQFEEIAIAAIALESFMREKVGPNEDWPIEILTDGDGTGDELARLLSALSKAIKQDIEPHQE